MHVGQVEVPEGVWIHPGGTSDLPITFANVFGISGLLHVGRKWRMQEGAKHVANAEVIALTKAV